MINLGIKRILAAAIVICIVAILIEHWRYHDVIAPGDVNNGYSMQKEFNSPTERLFKLLSLFSPGRMMFYTGDIEKRHFDVNEAIVGQFQMDEQALRLSLGHKAVRIKPVEEYRGLIENGDGLVTMTFYYSKVRDSKSGQRLRIIEKMSVSKQCLQMLLQTPFGREEINGRIYPQYYNADDQTYKEWADIALGHFNSLKNRLPIEVSDKLKQFDTYTQAELLSLQSFTIVRIMSLKLMKTAAETFGKEKELIALGLDMRLCVVGGMVSCHRYLVENYPWYFLYCSYRAKLIALTILIVLMVALWNAVCRDTEQIAREELYRLGVTMNRRMIWRIVMSNWRFFLFPAKDAKMRPIIAKACRAVYERQENRALCEQSEAVWQRCRGLTDHRSLEGEYRIASGRSKGADLDKRREALVRLLQGEQRLKQRKEKLAALLDGGTSQKSVRAEKRTKPAQSNRDEALELVRALIPEGIAVALEALSVEKLKRLARIINMIDGWHSAAVKTLLERNNLGVTLDAKSKLLAAVNTGDRTIALKELGLLEKKVSKSKDIIIAEYAEMLRGISVLIIGGGRTEGKRRELLEAIADLGAADCRIVSTDDRGKIRDAIEAGKELVVFIATDNSHGTKALLDKESVPYLTVNKLNRERFTRELIVQYQKTQSA